MEPPDPPLTEAEWEAHARGVRRLAHALVWDADRAEDVAQEALALAATRPGPPRASLRAWLAGVVRNLARNLVRGERRRRERERAAARPESLPAAASLVERLEQQRRVLDAVMRLEEPARSTVALRYFEGLSNEAVAARLGVPPETVRTRLRRARERLRADLDAGSEQGRRGWVLALLLPPGPPAPTGAALLAAASAAGGVAVKHTLVLVALALVAALGAGAWLLSGPAGRGSGGGRAPSEGPDAAGSGPSAAGPRLEGRTGPGTAAEGAEPPAAGLPGPPPIDLASVDRERDLHGTVLSPTRAPVAGARVRALTLNPLPVDPQGLRPWFEERVLAEGRSAADGAFALRLERGASVHLSVEAPGYADWERPHLLVGGRVEVVLEPAVRLVVAVEDARGAPVAGARLRFFQAGSLTVGLPRAPYAFRREGTTQAEGRCTFEGLPAGAWGFLDVSAPGLGLPAWERLVLPAAPAGAEHVHRLTLPDGRTVRGRVRDADTGAPLAGALVGAGWMRSQAVRTDAEGRYEFPGWTGAGSQELYASAAGHALTGSRVGERQEIDFDLPPSRPLSGRVVDGAGAPAAGATVLARTDRDPNGATLGSRTTGPDGRYAFDDLRTDARYRLTATRGGDLAGPMEVGEGTDPVNAPDLALGAGRRVEGRVRDARGEPVAGLEVLLSGHRGFCLTDDLGRFRLGGVPAGPRTLSVRGDGRARLERELPGAPHDLVGLELTLAASRPLTVRVELVDPGGAALPEGTTVVATGADGSVRTAYLDGRGQARLEAPEGEAVLTLRGVAAGWWAPEPQRVPADRSEAVLVVHRAGSVPGEVRGPGGQPVPFAQVVVRPAGREPLVVAADERGRFEAFVPPQARCELEFEGRAGSAEEPGRATERTPALYARLSDVVAGSGTAILHAREVESDAALLLVLTGPDGLPVEEAVALAGDPLRRAVSDAQGRARLEGLRGRPLTLTVHALGGRTRELGWLPLELHDVTPQGQTLALRFRQGHRLRGRLSGTGSQAGNLAVRAVRDGRVLAFANTDREGAFTLVVDPERDFPLVVEASATTQAEFSLRLPLDRPPAAPLELALPPR